MPRTLTIRPPLRVAGLQGDAVFSYAITGHGAAGQPLVEMIEGTYVALRRAVEQMVVYTTCACGWARGRRARPGAPAIVPNVAADRGEVWTGS